MRKISTVATNRNEILGEPRLTIGWIWRRSNENCPTSRDATKPQSWRPELDGGGAPTYGFV